MMTLFKIKTLFAVLLMSGGVFAAFAADEPPVSAPAPAPDTDKESQKTKVGDDSVVLDYSAIEMIAIQENGRKKPLHTHVREEIEKIIGRSVFASHPTLKYKVGVGSDEKTITLSMMEMFMSLWIHDQTWEDVPCLLVNYKPLKEVLKFKNTEDKYCSIKQLEQNTDYNKLLKDVLNKKHADGKAKLNDMETEVEQLYQRHAALYSLIKSSSTLKIIPHPTDETGPWISIEQLVESVEQNPQSAYYSVESVRELVETFHRMREAYDNEKAEEFKKTSMAFRMALFKLSPSVYPTVDTLALEVKYNKYRPFAKAWMFYFAAALLGLFTLHFRGNALYYATMATFLTGLGIHIYGFTLRCMIAGRPPVSNMYESVLWVAFGVVLFGLIFELIYKARYYMLCGATGGFCCLILMDQLPVIMGDAQLQGFGDAIAPLPPVLRDNFWLTVHVLTITISYSAFLLAWVLGHVTLTSHLIAPHLKNTHHALHQFIYRVMQIGVLLLTIGTILGGVWAYYSWGRFWGWDPKETWAFITLLCYLFVLHGRFTGWWGNFGMTVGSVVCFLSVMMAWYGVNFVLGQLGNGGLHSYGQGAGGEKWVLGIIIVDMIYTTTAITRYKLYQASHRLKSGEQNLSSTDPVDSVRAEFSE